MKIKQVVPRDFSVVTVFNMAARALQLVVTVALVRILSVEDYASYTVFFTTSSTILGIAGQSIAFVYVRYNTERMTKAEMTESAEKQREFAIKWFKKTTVPFVALVAICCVGAQLVFPVLNGDGYDASISMFQILCINAFSAYVFAPASALIMSLNHCGLQFAIALISLAINLVGNYLLIPLYGGIGTSIATTISQIALNVMMTVVVFRVGAKSIKLG